MICPVQVSIKSKGSSPVKGGGESVYVQLLLEQLEGLNPSSSLPSLLAWLVVYCLVNININ